MMIMIVKTPGSHVVSPEKGREGEREEEHHFHIYIDIYTDIDCLIYATHCNTLQHTATHCNTLQHTATHYNTHISHIYDILRTLTVLFMQHTATHCNTLQHHATHCNTYIPHMY